MEPTTKQLEEGMTTQLNIIHNRLRVLEGYILVMKKEIEQLKHDNLPTPKRELTYLQSKVLELHLEGKKGKDIAYDINRSQGDVSVIMGKLRKWKFCK